MSDYSKLKQLAEAADRQMPSPWSVHRDGRGRSSRRIPIKTSELKTLEAGRLLGMAWTATGEYGLRR